MLNININENKRLFNYSHLTQTLFYHRNRNTTNLFVSWVELTFSRRFYGAVFCSCWTFEPFSLEFWLTFPACVSVRPVASWEITSYDEAVALGTVPRKSIWHLRDLGYVCNSITLSHLFQLFTHLPISPWLNLTKVHLSLWLCFTNNLLKFLNSNSNNTVGV